MKIWAVFEVSGKGKKDVVGTEAEVRHRPPCLGMVAGM